MKQTILQAAAVMMLTSALTGCGNSQQGNQTEGDSGSDRTTEAMLANLGPYVSEAAAKNNPNPGVFLSLVKSTDQESSIIYDAKALHGEDTIGLQIEIAKDIPAGVFGDGEVNEEKGFTQGTIKFSSVGEQSDNFVQALSALYKLPVESGMTSSTLEPHVFSSNKTVVDLTENGTYSFKLSFENNAGEGAEVFATLDLFRRAFELRATNEAQFPLILSAFTGE